MEEIQWKIWKISKASGGRYGRARKGDVWECSNVGGLVRKNGVLLESYVNDGEIMHGYIILKDSGLRVHRIVAETWCVRPEDKKYKYVDHIDGNRLNNDAINLRWCTSSENVRNPSTYSKISEGKKRYGKFKEEHKQHISESGKLSYDRMNDKQRKIRYNTKIKGIYLHLNKETNTYDYYDSRFNGNHLSEDQVNEMLFKQGYDSNVNKLNDRI